MKKALFSLLLLILFTGGAWAFSFLVFGDNQGNYTIFNDVIKKMNTEKQVDFVVCTGDFLPAGEAAQYKKYLKTIKKLKFPVYHAMGNHDGCYGGWRNFEKYLGARYYSFDHQDARFVILDNALSESFDQTEFAWLKEQLAGAQGKRIFVFMHRPTFDPSELYKDQVVSGRSVSEELQKLFEKYHVNYVFAGHIHGYARRERNGVIYMVSGGAGGPLHLPPEFGGFYHYMRIDVNDDKITDKYVMLYE